VVEDRPIMSVKLSPSSSFPLLAKIMMHLQRGVSAIAEHLVETLAVIGLPVTSYSAECVPSAAYEGWKIRQGAQWIRRDSLHWQCVLFSAKLPAKL